MAVDEVAVFVEEFGFAGAEFLIGVDEDDQRDGGPGQGDGDPEHHGIDVEPNEEVDDEGDDEADEGGVEVAAQCSSHARKFGTGGWGCKGLRVASCRHRVQVRWWFTHRRSSSTTSSMMWR